MCVPGNKYRSQRRGSVGIRNWGRAASRKAIWWDLRLASLLTHLLLLLLLFSRVLVVHIRCSYEPGRVGVANLSHFRPRRALRMNGFAT